MAATMGMRMVQVAELLVTSVRKAVMRQMMATMSQPGSSPSTANCSPIHSDSPDTCNVRHEPIHSDSSDTCNET